MSHIPPAKPEAWKTSGRSKRLKRFRAPYLSTWIVLDLLALCGESLFSVISKILGLKQQIVPNEEENSIKRLYDEDTETPAIRQKELVSYEEEGDIRTLY